MPSILAVLPLSLAESERSSALAKRKSWKGNTSADQSVNASPFSPFQRFLWHLRLWQNTLESYISPPVLQHFLLKLWSVLGFETRGCVADCVWEGVEDGGMFFCCHVSIMQQSKASVHTSFRGPNSAFLSPNFMNSQLQNSHHSKLAEMYTDFHFDLISWSVEKSCCKKIPVV